ncbi:MAG: hypothetical protein R2796_04070 [Chitinophagaceae bacterium]|nr:hypothetical protein [Chitinophagaceae bacterium]
MQTFCTIVTPDYLPLAKTLYRSLQAIDTNVQLHILVLGDEIHEKNEYFKTYNLTSLRNYSLYNELEKKYAHTQTDKFRWSLKPVFISYLLDNQFDKVIYVDPDIFFFNDFQFLFDELNQTSVLLSPHWRDKNPFANEENFLANYKDGLYNGGFIGATKNGLPALKWWAGLCHYKMDRQISLGIYDDQRYLDSMPLYFSGVKILKHKGCNIANWNSIECKREKVNNEILINGQYPIIFIHFTKETILSIEKGHDKLLQPFLVTYKNKLQKENIDIASFINRPKKNLFIWVKEKTLIRTRIKRFFYRLAEKL